MVKARLGLTCAQSEPKERFNLPFVNDEGLRTLVLDRTDEGIFAWNEGTCIRTQTFILRFGSLELLGGAVGLLSEVDHFDGLGSTLLSISYLELL